MISPHQSLRIDDGRLCISTGARPKGAPIAIDHFFGTLAVAHRDRAIGLVLSGTGSDGTIGVGRLKEQGGVTVAQLPKTAKTTIGHDMRSLRVASTSCCRLPTSREN